MNETLHAKWLDTDRRNSMKWATYLPIYERHFRRYVNRPVRLLEIGVKDGGSLQLWKRFLGPYAVIVGIDIDPESEFAEDQIHVRIGSQTDSSFLESVIAEFGPFDIVIDDGSHDQPDMLATFDLLYGGLDRNGVYVAEDLHCAYWEKHGGGPPGTPGTFVTLLKALVDHLQVPSPFRDATIAMHIYTWVAVFERGATNVRVMHELGDDRGH